MNGGDGGPEPDALPADRHADAVESGVQHVATGASTSVPTIAAPAGAPGFGTEPVGTDDPGFEAADIEAGAELAGTEDDAEGGAELSGAEAGLGHLGPEPDGLGDAASISAEENAVGARPPNVEEQTDWSTVDDPQMPLLNGARDDLAHGDPAEIAAVDQPQSDDEALVPGGEASMVDFTDATPAPGFEDAIDETGEPEEGNLTQAARTSQLVFVDVLIVLPSSNPVVVLQEADTPYRELRIPIGGAEGVAIGYAARHIATPRPLTHELMSLILRDFDLTLDVVRITGSSGGSFTAEIVVSGPTGARTIDCRPSDAIALALRQHLPVPIVAAPGVIEQAGSGAAGSN